MLDPGILTNDHAVVVELGGEYDVARASDLLDSLLPQDRSSSHVIADRGAVTIMDSSALRALLEARNALIAEGGSLRLTAVPELVAVLLDITRTAELFELDEATG